MQNGRKEQVFRLPFCIFNNFALIICRVAGAQGGDARAQAACERSAWKGLALFPARRRLIGRLAVNQRIMDGWAARALRKRTSGQASRVGSPDGGSPAGGGLSGSRTGAAGEGSVSGGSGRGPGSGTTGTSGPIGGGSGSPGCGKGSLGCGGSVFGLRLICEFSFLKQ